MHSSTHNYFYQNALFDLMTGHLMPWEKDILSADPLPSTVIEPYMSKEVPDVRESMRLTYETMVVWIDEAKKVNYFSKRFVQLSKMIMNGVTSMGRGLITLHARGEALDGVPMSIQDLIGVASYHFRKSHLGVLQTVRSHPEVSERLLMNQIGWNNMLMRLFKTREKLETEARIQEAEAREDQGARFEGSVVSEVQEGRIQVPESSEDQSARIEELKENDSNLLPSGEKELLLSDGENDGFDPFKLFGPDDCGISEPAAIREPGAFTAPRAFLSYDKNKKPNQNKKTNQNKKPNQNKKSEIRNKKSNGTGENGEGRMVKEETNGTWEAEITKTKNEPQNEEKPQIRENDEESSGNRQNEGIDQDPENKKGRKENQPGRNNETESDHPKETPDELPLKTDDGPLSTEEEDGNCPFIGQSPTGKSTQENDSILDRDYPIKEQTPAKGQTPAKEEPSSSNLPLYLQILQNVFTRSGPSENGAFTFTYEELCYLVSDPDFCIIYPDQAAQMRSILQKIDSS